MKHTAAAMRAIGLKTDFLQHTYTACAVSHAIIRYVIINNKCTGALPTSLLHQSHFIYHTHQPLFFWYISFFGEKKKSCCAIRSP